MTCTKGKRTAKPRRRSRLHGAVLVEFRVQFGRSAGDYPREFVEQWLRARRSSEKVRA